MIADMSAMDNVSVGASAARTRSLGRLAAGVIPDAPGFGLRVGVTCDVPVTEPGGVTLRAPSAAVAAADPGGAIARAGRGEGMDSFLAGTIRAERNQLRYHKKSFSLLAVLALEPRGHM